MLTPHLGRPSWTVASQFAFPLPTRDLGHPLSLTGSNARQVWFSTLPAWVSESVSLVCRREEVSEVAEKRTGNMTVREAGQKGGASTRQRHGAEFFEGIGKKGGQARKQELGHAGYEELGRKGGQKVRELIAKGKSAKG